MDELLTACGLVTLAEMGDKTQLLTMLLAARYRAPWHIMIGILIATLANHAMAAYGGQLVASFLTPAVVSYVVAASMLALGAWVMVPDSLDEPMDVKAGHVVLATIIAFFWAEMGDKTQVATVVLGAKAHSAFAVTLGTTLGMMLANVPALWCGQQMLHRLPMRTVRLCAALLCFAVGAYALWHGMTLVQQ